MDINITRLSAIAMMLGACTLVQTTVAFAAEAEEQEYDFENPPANADQASELYDQANKGVTDVVVTPTTAPTITETEKALARQQARQGQRYDLAQLKSDPLVFTKFLNQALVAQDMQTVKELLPFYKAMAVKDPGLIAYAEALIFRSEGKNKQAIAIYRDMLAKDPSLHPVRLDMATAMRNDKQYDAAKEQFIRLKSEQLPAPILARIDKELNRLNKVEDWRFNAAVSYLHDNNLNDVPDEKISTSLGRTLEPIEGNGLKVSLGADKRYNLPQNFYAKIGGNLFVKAYWDESDYNDYLATVSAGVGYDDAKNDVSLIPFATKRYYNEDAYSTRTGATLRASRWFRPKLKLTGTATVSNESYDKEKDQNREADGLFLGVNGLYTQSATQYFYGGIGRYVHDVEKSDLLTYERNSVNVGWGKEWQKGISTRTGLAYAKKSYENAGSDLYNQSLGGPLGASRESTTTSVDLQLWKRDYTVFGLTPRLVLDYDTTDSNFAYYDDRDEFTSTVMLTKNF